MLKVALRQTRTPAGHTPFRGTKQAYLHLDEARKMESSYSVTFTATRATRVFEKQERVEDTGEMAKAKLQLSKRQMGVILPEYHAESQCGYQ